MGNSALFSFLDCVGSSRCSCALHYHHATAITVTARHLLSDGATPPGCRAAQSRTVQPQRSSGQDSPGLSDEPPPPCGSSQDSPPRSVEALDVRPLVTPTRSLSAVLRAACKHEAWELLLAASTCVERLSRIDLAGGLTTPARGNLDSLESVQLLPSFVLLLQLHSLGPALLLLSPGTLLSPSRPALSSFHQRSQLLAGNSGPDAARRFDGAPLAPPERGQGTTKQRSGRVLSGVGIVDGALQGLERR